MKNKFTIRSLVMILLVTFILPGCNSLFWPNRYSRVEYDPATGKLIAENSTPMFTEAMEFEGIASQPSTESRPGGSLSIKTKRNVDDKNFTAAQISEKQALKEIGQKILEVAEKKIP